MKQLIIRKYGTSEMKFTAKRNAYAHLAYQEIKTEWTNRKRKISWNLPFKINESYGK